MFNPPVSGKQNKRQGILTALLVHIHGTVEIIIWGPGLSLIIHSEPVLL